MRHLVLYGEFELSIDDKNRMLIPSEVRRQIDQSLIMLFGDEQTMTWKDRTMIEKGQAVVVFKDDASSEFAARDFAEQTGLMRLFRHAKNIPAQCRRRISFLSIFFATETAFSIELNVPMRIGLWFGIAIR